MRVPLEILRIILDHAKHDFKRAELLRLRMVCWTFDDEVCLILAPRRFTLMYHFAKPWTRQWRQNWVEAPALMKTWFSSMHPLSRYTPRPDFAETFFPTVFDRFLEQRGRADLDDELRCREVHKCLEFRMFYKWNVSWILRIVLEGRERPDKQTFVDRTMHEFEDHLLEYDEDTRLQLRFEADARFLETLRAISEDNRDAVLEFFVDSYVSPNDLNVCFGTTILAHAIAYGTREMVKLLLRSIGRLPLHRFLRYLMLAQARKNDAQCYVNTLLDHQIRVVRNKTEFTRRLLRRAGQQWSWNDKKSFTALSIPIWDWLVNAPGFSKLNVVPPSHGGPPPEEQRNARRSPSTDAAYPVSDKGNCFHDMCHLLKRPTQTRTIPYDKINQHVPQLFASAKSGQHNYIDWLLWAGADPRNVESEVSILELASFSEIREYNEDKDIRGEVEKMLVSWGWDLAALTVTYADLEQYRVQSTCTWLEKETKNPEQRVREYPRVIDHLLGRQMFTRESSDSDSALVDTTKWPLR